MKAIVVLVFALAAIGCAGGGSHRSSPWTVSPQGYHVAWNEQGSVTSGKLTVEQIYDLHHKAVLRAVDSLFTRHAIPKAESMAKAQSIAYNLVDNHSIPYGNGYVNGQWLIQSNCAVVPLYSAVTVATLEQVPPEAPKWATRPGFRVGGFVYGVLVPGNEFPALAHELGHALRGPTFEH